MKKTRAYFLLHEMRDAVLTHPWMGLFILGGSSVVFGWGLSQLMLHPLWGPSHVLHLLSRVEVAFTILLAIPAASLSWNVARMRLLCRPDAVSIALAIFVILGVALPVMAAAGLTQIVQDVGLSSALHSLRLEPSL